MSFGLDPFSNEKDPVYVSGLQKSFTYWGYYANTFARRVVRTIECLTRPTPLEKRTWGDVVERVKTVASACLSSVLAVALSIPALACYAIAACVGGGRLEFIRPQEAADFWGERSVKVMSWNVCFQDPWAPFTGGVVPPFEPVAEGVSRIAAIVNAIAQENPAIFMGQEFENLGAQDEFIHLMQGKGFSYFVRDLGSHAPVRNNSGLLIASRVPLEGVQFAPYLLDDREGLAKWSEQGALAVNISVEGHDIRLVNLHLNYGSGGQNQAARNRQLVRYALPMIRGENGALFGDLNFNTAAVDRKSAGLEGLVNALEGRVTCTDEGKHTLRGKSRSPNGQPCEDCEERIDGLIYDPSRIKVLQCATTAMRLNGQLLSDHYATIAELELKQAFGISTE